MGARHTRTAGAPVEGYARMYRTVPIDTPDALQAVKVQLDRLGYDVLDEDWWQQPTTNGERIFVAVWGRRKGWAPPVKKYTGREERNALTG